MKRVWVEYSRDYKLASGPRFKGERRYEDVNTAMKVCGAGAGKCDEFETGEADTSAKVIRPDTGDLGQSASRAG